MPIADYNTKSRNISLGCGGLFQPNTVRRGEAIELDLNPELIGGEIVIMEASRVSPISRYSSLRPIAGEWSRQPPRVQTCVYLTCSSLRYDALEEPVIPREIPPLIFPFLEMTGDPRCCVDRVRFDG